MLESLFHWIRKLRQFLCRLRSIATHRDHFVRRPSVCLSVCPSVCHTFQSYVSQATHAFLGMLPLFFYGRIYIFTFVGFLTRRCRCTIQERQARDHRVFLIKTSQRSQCISDKDKPEITVYF